MSKNLKIYRAKITIDQISSIIKSTNPTSKRPFHSHYELGACMQNAFPEKYETFRVINYLNSDPLTFETAFLEDFCYTFNLDKEEFKTHFEPIKAPLDFVKTAFLPLRHIQLHRDLQKLKESKTNK